MSELPKLHRVIRLAQTSRRRFRTLRLTIRDWADFSGISHAQGHSFDGNGETTREDTVRVWLELEPRSERIWADPTARIRLEDRSQVGVRDGRRWWLRDRKSGAIIDSHETKPDELEPFDAFLHFADVAWLTRRGAHVAGPASVAGRDGIALVLPGDAPEFGLLPGTDRYRFTLDAERGVLLRAECFFGGELIAVEEAVEIAFDEKLDPALFEEPS